jgi:hypothetical protein
MSEHTGRRAAGDSSVPAVTGEMTEGTDACCKIERVGSAYNLGALNAEIQRRYETDGATLHGLAEYINNRITTVALDAIDWNEYEPATVRAALQGEQEIPATERDDIRATLAGQLDVEMLTGNYISHETVRRHLNEHLGVSTSQGGFDTRAELRSALVSYQKQYEDGVESALERAASEGLIDGETFRVFSTRTECDLCSETYRLQELLDNGGCDCQQE